MAWECELLRNEGCECMQDCCDLVVVVKNVNVGANFTFTALTLL